jgi:hypothetical protein
VIDASNDNMPYDQFTIEQLAGDLLPNPTTKQLLATAFHRNTLTNDEGGTNDEEFRTYAVIDRVNTTFDALHKPASTASMPRSTRSIRSPRILSTARLSITADADGRMRCRRAAFTRRRIWRKPRCSNGGSPQRSANSTANWSKENREAFDAWLREVRPTENFLPLHETKVTSTKGEYRVLTNGQVRLAGAAPTDTTLTVEGAPAPGRFQALVLATLPDDSLPNRGPGAAGTGNFILTASGRVDREEVGRKRNRSPTRAPHSGNTTGRSPRR